MDYWKLRKNRQAVIQVTPTFRYKGAGTSPPAPPEQPRTSRMDELLCLLDWMGDRLLEVRASGQRGREELSLALKELMVELQRLRKSQEEMLRVAETQRECLEQMRDSLSTLMTAAEVIAHGNILPIPAPPRRHTERPLQGHTGVFVRKRDNKRGAKKETDSVK